MFGGGYSVDETVGGTSGLQPQQGYHMRGSYPTSSGTTEVANGAANPTTWTALLQAGGQGLAAGSHMNLHSYAMCATPPPTLTVTCAPGSVRVGSPATCTATVTGTTHPSGTVGFSSDSGGTFGTPSCTLSPLGGDQSRCSVTYTPSAVGGGTQTVTAAYSGDAGNPASRATAIVRVGPGATTTSVSCSPSAVVVGSPHVHGDRHGSAGGNGADGVGRVRPELERRPRVDDVRSGRRSGSVGLVLGYLHAGSRGIRLTQGLRALLG